MPSIGHAAIGLAAARGTPAVGRSRWPWAFALVVLSYVPDLDVLAFRFGIPYAAEYGHRGASHSLLVAVGLALVWAGVGMLLGLRFRTAFVMALLVSLSHGVLDAFTSGGKGVALFWPFDDHRVFSAWRPIPVAPLGSGLFTRRGVDVMLKEAALFLPFLIVAFWPTGGSDRGPRRGPTRR